MEVLKNNKYLVFALLFAFLNMAAVFFIFGFQQYGDTISYIDAIHWLQGKDIEVDHAIMLRPLGVFLAMPFEFLGEGAGLILQDIIFYLLCAFLIFKITELIYRDKKLALLAVLFFVTVTQVLEVGLAYLTDMGAWFFFLFSVFLTLLYFHPVKCRSAAIPQKAELFNRVKNKKEWLIPLIGLVSGLGFLMKENGALGVLFFGLMILLSKEFDIKEKASKIVRFGIFFLIPVAALQFFMYQYFRFTSLDWYLYQLQGFSHGEGFALVLLRYFGQLFRTLGILWILFFIGLWQELREKNWQRLKIFLALAPASLSFFLWPISGGGRSVFIFAPLGILLAVYGCKKIRPSILALIIAVILVSNYWFVSVNQEIPFIDLIYTSLFSR